MAPAPETEPVTLDELLTRTSRTFALSIPRLPEPTRLEVTIAYLLFRIADTLEDATLWNAERRRDQLRRFDGLLADGRPEVVSAAAKAWRREPPVDHPGYLQLLDHAPEVLHAFSTLGADSRRAIRDHLHSTIERMIVFVDAPVGSVDELREYCYAVAGLVGEMLTELFLIGNDTLAPRADFLRRRAARFGEALQLVNILKDATDDREQGRWYLPASVDPAIIFRLARNDLIEAGSYVRTLHAAGAPRGLVEFTALPVLLAWATLERVETSGPGVKLTRPEVAGIAADLAHALDRGESGVPERQRID